MLPRMHLPWAVFCFIYGAAVHQKIMIYFLFGFIIMAPTWLASAQPYMRNAYLSTHTILQYVFPWLFKIGAGHVLQKRVLSACQLYHESFERENWNFDLLLLPASQTGLLALPLQFYDVHQNG
jgi:hypothetical protein